MTIDKTYYIATGIANVARHAAAREVFEADRDEARSACGRAGVSLERWHLTYDWTVAGKVDADHLRPSIAIAEVEAVRQAWLTLMLLPGGRGAHVELGVALGQDGVVIVVTPPDAPIETSPIFYHHPLVHHACSLGEAREIAERLWHFCKG